MKLSFNWLKNYVNLPDSVTPEEVAEKLKLSTVEVEGVEKQGMLLENVVVGKVLTAEKHPNADKLKVCKVDLGNEQVTIVCGGSNVSEGMLAAVAKNGAKVKWHGEGELVELKPATIRGVESNGMICGADEIGLIELFPKKEEKEIVDLSSLKAKPGTPMAEALELDDAVLEIDNKSLSNRPDLWGHYGMAREVAVLFNREVEKYKTEEIKEGKEIKIKVEIEDAKLCPRYMAVAISGIKVGESPAWLKQKLTTVGLRPINNIVDITNYVMLDLGQPMHAFDVERIKSKEKVNIVVRRAKEEKFTTLDEKEHELNSDMLMITNGEKSLALAGIMGGLESGITDKTTAIVFESANFEAASIRKTSTKLGIRTDSSARFEKSLDPNLCKTALEKAVALVMEVCPEVQVVSKVVDEKHFRLQTGPLEVPFAFFADKIGVAIPTKTIITILERLGFEVKEKKYGLSVKIPTWRATKDISIPEDIVEEVLRIYGYDNVPSSLPMFTITPPEKNALRELEYQVHDLMVRELGFTEVYNYSFVSATQIAAFGEGAEKYLELDNPISKEKPFVRRHLLNNLLENIKDNIESYPSLKLFEIGKVFRAEDAGPRTEKNGDELLPRQDTWLTAVYANKQDKQPFMKMRQVLEALNIRLGMNLAIDSGDGLPTSHHPSRAVELFFNNTQVGALYELHPMVLEKVELKERVGVLELNLSTLKEVDSASRERIYKSLPLYPVVVRDVAFLVKSSVAHGDIISAMLTIDPLVKNVELFDVFSGKGIAEGYKSMAYHITYASPERTLTSEEVDVVQKKIESLLKEKYGAEMRA